jgi:hypothetical protein
VANHAALAGQFADARHVRYPIKFRLSGIMIPGKRLPLTALP